MKITVAGCGGRMGREVLKALLQHPEHELAAGYVAAGTHLLSKDTGVLAGLEASCISVTSNLPVALEAAEAVIDFTTPAFTLTLAAEAAKRGFALITGTTGLSDDQQDQLEHLAQHAVIVQSFNMSLGVNLLATLVEQVAATLGQDYDIEIMEMHHRKKLDAPSGTALLLGMAAARGRRVKLNEVAKKGRSGVSEAARPEGEIGFASLRGGEVVGDHTVIFAGPGERIELTHKASSRANYAEGAVTAAEWSQGRKPGLYSMRDVLALG